ncbi:MAG: hypothetical protein M1833_006082 [Piccolia ochrophora]|nr:MAG: hypothetical protein M1833_006082 [Piccolia ochrophora]
MGDPEGEREINSQSSRLSTSKDEAERQDLSESAPSRPPPPPSPSTDTAIIPPPESPKQHDANTLHSLNAENLDIFTLSPVTALKLMCADLETIVQLTGDIPPTPPVSHPSTPKLTAVIPGEDGEPNWGHHQPKVSSRPIAAPQSSDEVDGVPIKKTPIGSPEAAGTEPLTVIGSGAEPAYIQQGAITRKFYSKKPPPIPLEEYLLRLQRYCPMSTAIYLATSLFIHRLAILEKILPVTRRNVHRLVLGGLRVSMKALEDMSYPHRRFAKVGGVTEAELGRLEISFCFVTNFELKVDREMLFDQAKSLVEAARSPATAVSDTRVSQFRDSLELPVGRPKHAATDV